MEGTRRTTRLATAALGALALTAAGCGEDDFANKPRPPIPITVTASISDDAISVSPAEFGAGTIRLLVANQTGAAQEVTLESDEIGGTQAGVAARESGAIEPGSTAEVKVDLREGEYKLDVGGEGIDDATLDVGPPRPSGQNELLLP